MHSPFLEMQQVCKVQDKQLFCNLQGLIGSAKLTNKAGFKKKRKELI